MLVLPDEIRARRLILRKPRPSDSPQIFSSYTSDAAVARFTVWRPHQDISETTAFITHCIESWHGNDKRPYVLALLDSEDIPIGMLEGRLLSHTVDIGYVLEQKRWGSGLMSEAVTAVSNAALALCDCFRVQATCDVENVASARTLEKSGFSLEGRLERLTVHPNLDPTPRPCLMFSRHKSPENLFEP